MTFEEKKLALKNALRYFPKKHHKILIREFYNELKKYGRIYMYRFKPSHKITAENLNAYPHKSKQAAAIMMMLNNNLDEASPIIAQHSIRTYNIWWEWFSFSELGSVQINYEISF